MTLELDAVAATPSSRPSESLRVACSSRDHVSHRMGKIATRSELANRYGVKVKWLSELQEHCSKAKCYVPRGRNSDSGKRIDECLPLPVELPTLVHSTTIPNHCFVALAEARVIKSIDERKLLRYASWVSSNAHAEVMREAKAGMMEYQLEARFLYHCASLAVWKSTSE